MGLDFSVWHPGLILAFVAVIGAFTTGLIITAFSVGMIQWRKAHSLREMRKFADDLINQGYTVDEIERLSAAFFEQRPGHGYAAKLAKAPSR